MTVPASLLDLDLNQDDALAAAALDFARTALNHDVGRAEHDSAGTHELFRRCGEFGVLALLVPKELGGAGGSVTDLIVVMEALGFACRDQGLLFSLNAHLWTALIPVLAYGSDAQKRELVPKLSDGTWIGANGATEPDAGSDVCAMRTRARKQDDGYVITGEKLFVTNAPVADVFFVYATLDPALGPMGITAFMVPRDTPGLSVRTIDKMGLSTSPMGELVMNDCYVPTSARLGREGRGLQIFEHSMEWERGFILAPAIGVMQHLLDRCVSHTRRRAGNRGFDDQAVAHRIADMKLRVELARTYLHAVARLKEHGRSTLLESAVAKLYISESYVRACTDAMDIFGVESCVEELGLERELRDAMASPLYSGTSEIQRNIIAKNLGV